MRKIKLKSKPRTGLSLPRFSWLVSWDIFSHSLLLHHFTSSQQCISNVSIQTDNQLVSAGHSMNRKEDENRCWSVGSNSVFPVHLGEIKNSRQSIV
jgi:hypothetical protein